MSDTINKTINVGPGTVNVMPENLGSQKNPENGQIEHGENLSTSIKILANIPGANKELESIQDKTGKELTKLLARVKPNEIEYINPIDFQEIKDKLVNLPVGVINTQTENLNLNPNSRTILTNLENSLGGGPLFKLNNNFIKGKTGIFNLQTGTIS